MKLPKVSIIIACKNANVLLKETLKNVQQQHYAPLEVIVIDGYSCDGTAEILKKNSYPIVTKWISERDEGISDAFNKGIALSTGEYINFQGAGDTFYHPKVVAELFSDLDQEYDLVCGRVERVKEDGLTPLWISPKHPAIFYPRSLLFRMTLPHQALFTHRRFFEQYGQFDRSLRFAMDYELLLRPFKNKVTYPNTKLSNAIIARWRAGGVGTDRIPDIFDEYHAIKLKHRVAPRGVLQAIDSFNRIKYHIKKVWRQE